VAGRLNGDRQPPIGRKLHRGHDIIGLRRPHYHLRALAHRPVPRRARALESVVLGRQDRAPHRGPKGAEGVRAPDAHAASTYSTGCGPAVRDRRAERRTRAAWRGARSTSPRTPTRAGTGRATWRRFGRVRSSCEPTSTCRDSRSRRRRARAPDAATSVPPLRLRARLRARRSRSTSCCMTTSIPAPIR
jgi:hypothetical protein